LNDLRELARQPKRSNYSLRKDSSVNDSSFFYYGMVGVSLALFGLLLTVLEFRRMAPSKNLIDLTRQREEEAVSTTTHERGLGIG
jgi:hypothetical protein